MIGRTLRFLAILTCVILLGASTRSIRAQELGVVTDWQTYTDIDYGFSFSFPIGWQAETLYSDIYSSPEINHKRIALRDDTASLIYVSVWSLAEDQDMQEWLSLHQDHFYSSQVTIPEGPNAVVAGQPAWFVISPAGEQLPGIAAVIMERDGLVYAIEYIARENGSTQEIVAQVLESFRILQSTNSW